MRTVNRTTAAMAAGVSYATLAGSKWMRDRTPAAPNQKGKRDREQWTVPQILAIRVARILEHKFGCTIASMKHIFKLIWMMDEDRLRGLFAEGRKYVLLIGLEPVANALLTFKEIHSVRVVGLEGVTEVEPYKLAALEIEREYTRICAAILLRDLEGETEGEKEGN